jgi:hypothetical protein
MEELAERLRAVKRVAPDKLLDLRELLGPITHSTPTESVVTVIVTPR